MNREKAVIQKELESFSYPQNYYYDIETLQPIGLFKNRIDAFVRGVPELFKGYNSFLDIGSSLGYFLFYHSLKSKEVVGIESNQLAISLCMKIKYFRNAWNVKLANCKFSEYFTNGNVYDLVFIGNAFHYLYADEGWGVLDRLRKISKLLVMEFPMEGKHLVEIGGWEDDEKTRNFTENIFKEAVKQVNFSIVRIEKSGTAGERKIVVLK